MSENPKPPEPDAIQLMVDAIGRGKRIVERSDLSAGSVRTWTVSGRYALRKVFGPNSPILDLWPKFETLVPKDAPRPEMLERLARLEELVEGLTSAATKVLAQGGGKRVFIGHGRSPIWRELKDFFVDRLALQWDEFNREAAAGFTTSERLHTMLDRASFAVLLMTAEDQHADLTLHARANVVHEIGLFQGRLGPRRAIVLLEEGCETFSNIHGLSHVSFPRGRISAAFEDLRRVLERERIFVGT